MINYINKISSVLIFLLIIIGCGDDKNRNIRGSEFRSLEIESAKFDVCDTSSFYSMTVEVEDYKDGNLLDNVTVFISFVDYTIDGMTYTTAEKQITVIDAGDFTEGPNGLPITTFVVTLDEVNSALGLNTGSYGLEDLFRIRFETNLTDGRSFSDDNGSMYVYDAGLSCTSFDEPDFFTGQYLMEQLSGLDPFFASETFGDTQIVNITANGNIRSFNFLYFPGIFDSDYNFSMNLCCGEILVTGTINAGGLGCGGSNIGFSTGNPVSTYDQTFIDDDIITVNVTDFSPDGSCDTGGYPVELRFTKQ
jgi:hypothetical protein